MGEKETAVTKVSVITIFCYLINLSSFVPLVMEFLHLVKNMISYIGINDP